MMTQLGVSPSPEKTYPTVRRFDRGLESVEDVLAAEQAWLRLKKELEEQRRQKEIMGETLHYLKGTLRTMERQVAAAREETRRAEERFAVEVQQREVLKWEMTQLQERLSQAVAQVASERSKGWLQRLLGR